MLNKISVIGLGYVGLPLFIELSKSFKTKGFDINKSRTSNLKKGIDLNNETTSAELKKFKNRFTSEDNDIEGSDAFIIATPTPVDKNNIPDLKILISATELVASKLVKGNLVVFESTVYPGCTEEVCVPILERISGLKYNKDFGCGYSPERINPGDSQHTIRSVNKIISASNANYLKLMFKIYSSVVDAEVYKAKNIKTAEAAKIIENIQRDVNIALVNEWAILFNKMGIETNEVLEAAGTKWNFLNFSPGLVGGHCIGVDPYYLEYKAKNLGIKTQMLSSGRAINDNMPKYIANEIHSLIKNSKYKFKDIQCTILGFTFKENCPDVRNTKIYNLYQYLNKFTSSFNL